MLVGGVVIALVVMVAVVGRGRDRGGSAQVEAPTPTAAVAPTSRATAIPTPAPTPVPTSAPTVASSPAPPVTAAPRSSGPTRLAYAAFLARVNDDRATVNGLNSALSASAETQDADAVRRAAVDILDFVDIERDWLREHPPAACYAVAHAAANAMLDAYGTAADAFIAWAATGGGLAGLAALGQALDTAQGAADALTSFGTVLGATRCPA